MDVESYSWANETGKEVDSIRFTCGVNEGYELEMFIHLSMRQLLRIKKVFVECSRSKDSEEIGRFGMRNKYRNVKRSMVSRRMLRIYAV